MLILDTVNKSLEIILNAAVTTTEFDYSASYIDVDINGETIAAYENDGSSNGTTAVTIIAAPIVDVTRRLYDATIINNDTVSNIVTIRLNNTGVYRTIFRATLLPGEYVIYSGSWLVYDADGIPKTANPIYVTAGANLGDDTNGVFAQKVGGELQFKSLIAGSNITLTPSATEIEINSSGSGTVTDGNNVGAGAGQIFKVLSGTILDFRTITPASSKITVSTGTNTVSLDLAVSQMAFNEVPTGAIDGVNAIFTLSNTPTPVGLLMVYKAGLAQLQGLDYTMLTATQVEFVVGNEPRIGDNVFCQYWY